MFTLLLDGNAIRSFIVMLDVINVVEEAFRISRRVVGKMLTKTCLPVEYGNLRAMCASLPGYEGVKCVYVHPETPYRGLLPI